MSLVEHFVMDSSALATDILSIKSDGTGWCTVLFRVPAGFVGLVIDATKQAETAAVEYQHWRIEVELVDLEPARAVVELVRMDRFLHECMESAIRNEIQK